MSFHYENHDWKLYPINGNSQQAFMARRDDEKLFFKRNASPFTATLSVQGITPRLVWTKRLENGDILTAQEWLEGRNLRKNEMNSKEVVRITSKIHHSDRLLQMLKKVGGEVFTPVDFVKRNQALYTFEHEEQEWLLNQFDRLTSHLPDLPVERYTVCHGDMSHKNWMLANNNRLYLVDWDGAVIADPAWDLGSLLYSYVPEEYHRVWLKEYGLELTEDLKERMLWYAQMGCIWGMMKSKQVNDEKAVQRHLNLLKTLSK